MYIIVDMITIFQDQCLHGRLGSVVVSWPVGESR